MIRLLLFPLILFLSEEQEVGRRHADDEVPPVRPLTPPFPDGLCGGRLVTLPPEETYYYHYNGKQQKQLHNNNNILLPPPRPIHVWLPPEYHDDNHHRYKNKNERLFPVLFCHDGQNVMQDSSSWTGVSWRMMGALTRLVERNMLQTPYPPIVVMMPSAPSSSSSPGIRSDNNNNNNNKDLMWGIIRRRHLEYGDTSNAFAQAHVDFVAQTLYPVIHTKFRTDPHQNYAIGSSLGGQASLHLLLRYPDLFQGAACLSPAFQLPTLASVATQQGEKLKGKRIYMDIGGDMDDTKVSWFDILDHMTPTQWHNPGYWWLDTQLQPAVDAMSLALQMAAGSSVEHDFCYEKFPGARHNERAWSLRIHKPLLHLLGK